MLLYAGIACLRSFRSAALRILGSASRVSGERTAAVG